MHRRRSRKKSIRHIVMLLISILCVSIVSQILGLPLSFANLKGTSDLIEASHLEGVAITSSPSAVSAIRHVQASLATWSEHYNFPPPIYSLFRPPNHFMV
jgi:hypothetical protein